MHQRDRRKRIVEAWDLPPVRSDSNESVDPHAIADLVLPSQAGNKLFGVYRGEYWIQGELDPLSNFYPSPIEIDGERFGSVEAFIQCTKYREDNPFREKIRDLSGPYAKRSGKRSNRAFAKESHGVKGLRRKVYWKGEEIVYGSKEHHSLIERAIRVKFMQNPEAREALIQTGTMPLRHDPKLRIGLEENAVVKLQKGRRHEDTALPNHIFTEILTRLREELFQSDESDKS